LAVIVQWIIQCYDAQEVGVTGGGDSRDGVEHWISTKTGEVKTEMWKYRLFFSAQPVRGYWKTLTVGVVIWYVSFVLLERFLKTPVPVGQLLFVTGVLPMPWCALRLNRPQIACGGGVCEEVGVVGVVCLAQDFLILVKEIRFSAALFTRNMVIAEPIRVILIVVGMSMLLFFATMAFFC